MTGKTIDNMTKCKIIAMSEQNILMRKIAKHLNTTHPTVSRIINQYHEYNTIENIPRPGRPSISNERNEQSLIRIVKKNRKLSSTDLSRKWHEASGDVASAQTIRRVLQKHNYMWRAACKKPRLSKKHQKARKNCCS
ncbi:uncharacterized protein LOC136078584 [Hydra vulgaris]|uniref:Uncharacterized protein LOC136078584 n=1 Tax=Hydra vulgaris TaxID=6087 RepID=A0ABM4BMX3_HYDVU